MSHSSNTSSNSSIELSQNSLDLTLLFSPLHALSKQLLISSKSNFIASSDSEIDLWYLINSDILVLSKSNFSYLAGLFHKGSKIYYPIKPSFASVGLGSKFDKSGWISYN